MGRQALIIHRFVCGILGFGLKRKEEEKEEGKIKNSRVPQITS